LITKVKFFTHSGLTAPLLVFIFLLKVLIGVLYGWMLPGWDSWAYHNESLKAYHLLLSNPHDFFISLFGNNYESVYDKFFSSNNSWWNDLHSNSFIMLLAFFNLMSFGNYYVNVLFYSFITLSGPVAVYRIMQDVFPGKRLVVFSATFLLPSFLLWTSGILKDGLLFTGFALVIYNVYFGLKFQKFTWQKWVLILVGFLIILALRNYLLLILLPALLAWCLAQKLKYRPILVFGLVYLLSVVLFFTAKYLHPRFDWPAAVVEKQKSFLVLEGNSEVPVTPLQPTLSSFIKNAPQALAVSVLRPYPADVKNWGSLAASIEINLLLLCFVVFLFCHKKSHAANAFLLFCLFFSFSTLLSIGYTVNILGAVVRYRSTVLPFLVIPMMALIDWDRIRALFHKKHW